ncbi:hypothetical protein [Celeribacter sp.]|uniref:hypothetical protein n=1 Tax=Celeribacter sp. TaxID=1890673 RepID=UPI003A957903
MSFVVFNALRLGGVGTMRFFSALYVAALFAFAAEASDCNDRNSQCTEVVGCVLGAPNEMFVGEVYGVSEGDFGVITTKGAQCRGAFERTQEGTAVVETECSDGRTGSAVFDYFDLKSGTGRGAGKMSDGAQIVFWSGENLKAYFESGEGAGLSEFSRCASDALEALNAGATL